jgi:hypothetical protein
LLNIALDGLLRMGFTLSVVAADAAADLLAKRPWTIRWFLGKPD